MIQLTDNAIARVRAFQAADPAHVGKAFRIAIDQGGCSGFQYEFRFDTKQEGDREFPFGDVTILIDVQSLPFLGGSTVDYVEDFHGASFVVTNPNATSECGCGKSFGA